MAASPSDFHYVEAGDRLTACEQPASGRDGVLFRTNNPEQVTCEVCRRRKKLRGPVQASAKRVAEAGRIIEAAMARGGITQRLEQRQRRRRS